MKQKTKNILLNVGISFAGIFLIILVMIVVLNKVGKEFQVCQNFDSDNNFINYKEGFQEVNCTYEGMYEKIQQEEKCYINCSQVIQALTEM